MARILIVDDEQITLMGLREELANLGHEITGSAKTGPDAVKIAKMINPELIFMDINMPGPYDGIEAARIIENELSIPIIFITAYENEHYLKEIKTMGPFGYITKPYKKIELEACIHIALFRNRMECQLKKQIENEVLINNILTEVSRDINPYEKLQGILHMIKKSLDMSAIYIYEFHDNAFHDICSVCDSRAKKEDICGFFNSLNKIIINEPEKKLSIDNLNEYRGAESGITVPSNFASVLYIPVSIEGKYFGGIYFANRLDKFFTQEIERFLLIICNTIAIIVEKNQKLIRIKRFEEEKQLKEMMIMRINRFASLGQLSSSISHEISQPLHKIKILSDSAIYWDKNNKKIPYEDILANQQKISDYVNHIDKIIKNLKLLIKSPDKLKLEVININTVIREIVQLYNQKLINHSINVSLKLDEDIPGIRLSDILFQQLVINLLDNAVNALDNFEKNNKLITLETGCNGKKTYLKIIDNGPGVSDEDKEEIFQPFYSANHKYSKGMGIGLYIVHNILELVNASIEVKDNKYGGATFFIRFNSEEQLAG